MEHYCADIWIYLISESTMILVTMKPVDENLLTPPDTVSDVKLAVIILVVDKFVVQ